MDSKQGAVAQLMKKGGASAADGIKKSLDDELNEGETQLTKKMKEEKADFVKKF